MFLSLCLSNNMKMAIIVRNALLNCSADEKAGTLPSQVNNHFMVHDIYCDLDALLLSCRLRGGDIPSIPIHARKSAKCTILKLMRTLLVVTHVTFRERRVWPSESPGKAFQHLHVCNTKTISRPSRTTRMMVWPLKASNLNKPPTTTWTSEEE